MVLDAINANKNLSRLEAFAVNFATPTLRLLCDKLLHSFEQTSAPSTFAIRLRTPSQKSKARSSVEIGTAKECSPLTRLSQPPCELLPLPNPSIWLSHRFWMPVAWTRQAATKHAQLSMFEALGRALPVCCFKLNDKKWRLFERLICSQHQKARRVAIKVVCNVLTKLQQTIRNCSLNLVVAPCGAVRHV